MKSILVISILIMSNQSFAKDKWVLPVQKLSEHQIKFKDFQRSLYVNCFKLNAEEKRNCEENLRNKAIQDGVITPGDTYSALSPSEELAEEMATKCGLLENSDEKNKCMISAHVAFTSKSPSTICEEANEQYASCNGIRYVRDLKDSDGLKRDIKKIEQYVAPDTKLGSGVPK
jgi:hypothetical protein